MIVNSLYRMFGLITEYKMLLLDLVHSLTMQAAVLLISQNDYEQVEEYRGARDLHSLKEFVVLMKARVGATVDIIDERVPEYSTPEEDEPVDDDDEEEEEEEDEEEAEKPAQV